MLKKKLQVFISSTFEDLKAERQEAVQAILKNDHIPAGMELFKAGNKSQLEVVKKWIEESDIYMLILGGRYGSIEPESKLSYTEVEYDYAIKQGIPVFTLILTESFLYNKQSTNTVLEVFEKENKDKYQAFKDKVMNKVRGEVNNIDQIASETGNSIRDMERDSSINFRGWVRPDTLIEEIPNYNQMESDKERLAEIVNFFEEENNLSEFEGVATYCSYDNELSNNIRFVIQESEKPSKQFINEDIQTNYEVFFDKLKKYNSYLIFNFFTRKGISTNRYYLYPDLNPDFSFPDDPNRYFKYVAELNDVVNEMVEGYKKFIRDTRKIIA